MRVSILYDLATIYIGFAIMRYNLDICEDNLLLDFVTCIIGISLFISLIYNLWENFKRYGEDVKMERLTTKRSWEETSQDLENEFGYSYIWKRLNEIEDILGDEYDLNELKELYNKYKQAYNLIYDMYKLLLAVNDGAQNKNLSLFRHPGAGAPENQIPFQRMLSKIEGEYEELLYISCLKNFQGE